MNDAPATSSTHGSILTEDVERARYERGAEMLARVDGEGGQKVVESLADIAPALAHHVVAYSFGDVYARPGLTPPQQLVTLGMLTALGGMRASTRRPHQRVPERGSDTYPHRRSDHPCRRLLRLPEGAQRALRRQTRLRRARPAARGHRPMTAHLA